MVESDIHSIMSILINMETQQNSEIIEKPTVRPIEVFADR